MTLDELVALYETSFKRQDRLIKTIGAAMGIEFEDESDVELNQSDIPLSSDEVDAWLAKQGLNDIVGNNDLLDLQYGLGYEVVEEPQE